MALFAFVALLWRELRPHFQILLWHSVLVLKLDWPQRPDSSPISHLGGELKHMLITRPYHTKKTSVPKLTNALVAERGVNPCSQAPNMWCKAFPEELQQHNNAHGFRKRCSPIMAVKLRGTNSLLIVQYERNQIDFLVLKTLTRDSLMGSFINLGWTCE